MLTEERLINDEYEKQYYGFSSTQIYVDLCRTVERYFKNIFLEYGKAIENAGKELPRELLLKEFENCLVAAEIPLNKFYVELQKIFEVPKNVVLPEDIEKLKNFTETDIQNLERKCFDLQQKYLQRKIYLAKLKQQIEIIETVILPKRNELKNLINEVNSKEQHKFKNILVDLEKNLDKLNIDFIETRPKSLQNE